MLPSCYVLKGTENVLKLYTKSIPIRQIASCICYIVLCFLPQYSNEINVKHIGNMINMWLEGQNIFSDAS